MKTKTELYNLLNQLHVEYTIYYHAAIHNIIEAKKYASEVPPVHVKNLLLQDVNKRLYLIVVLDYKRIDLKKLAELLPGSKRLTFASNEILAKVLGVQPGSVSPLALINDTNKQISLLFAQEILNETKISLHPLINTETISITLADLFKFIDYCGYRYTTIKDCFQKDNIISALN